MRSRKNIFILLIFFFMISSLSSPLISQKRKSLSSEIKIIAHYKEKVNDKLIATGNVEINYKDIKLFADRVDIDITTKDVYAEGNVVLQMPEEVLSADSIQLNLDSSRGELHNVFGMVKPTILYEAKNIDRKDETIYSFRKAKITSCTQPLPRWSFSCSRADLKKDDYIKMWNAVFSIRKIPIFYLPYFRYPLNRERATGFLMPQLGYSGLKGVSYSQSFYWALKRNMDATFSFDYYSERGMGGGLEYRYLFSAGTGGNIRFYFFKFKPGTPLEELKQAYIFRVNHNQPLPFNFSLVASVNHQSSYDFLREFDNNYKRAVVSNRSSQVYLSRAWSYFNFNARVSRFETYFAQIDKSIIRYNLPEIQLSSSLIKIFEPLYFRFSSYFQRWEFGWNNQYLNNNQKRSQDLIIKPEISIPFTTIPWLTLNTSLSSNFSYHFQTYAPASMKIVDEPILSKKYAFSVKFTGPVFYRIFFGSQNTPKLKHIIEPSFAYYYENPIASSDRIITAFPYYRYHYIRYGLTNRILIRQKNMPREVFTVGINQTFYLDPKNSPMSRYPIEGRIRAFSNISGYIRFYPSRRYTLDVTASFNPYNKNFSSLRLAGNMGSLASPFFLRVNWYRSINPYGGGLLANRHQISFMGQVNIPKLALKAQAAFDYNILQKELLYSAFVLVYQYQCLDIKASCRIFYFRETPEVQFRISFGLGNVGKTTDFLGGLEF